MGDGPPLNLSCFQIRPSLSGLLFERKISLLVIDPISLEIAFFCILILEAFSLDIFFDDLSNIIFLPNLFFILDNIDYEFTPLPLSPCYLSSTIGFSG